MANDIDNDSDLLYVSSMVKESLDSLVDGEGVFVCTATADTLVGTTVMHITATKNTKIASWE